MNEVYSSSTGRQGAHNSEQEAFQGIVQALRKCDFPPILYCGKRRFSEMVEIMSGEMGMLSREQRRLLKKTAEKCGYFIINAQAEKIDVRSGVAWNVEPVKYPIVRTDKLLSDEVMIGRQKVTAQ